MTLGQSQGHGLPLSLRLWLFEYYDCVIQIQLTSEKQWAKHDFKLYVHVTLTSIYDVSRPRHPYVLDNNGDII